MDRYYHARRAYAAFMLEMTGNDVADWLTEFDQLTDHAKRAWVEVVEAVLDA